MTRPGSQEIGVQRQDDIGFLEVVNRFERLCKSPACGFAQSISQDRFITVPARLGKLLVQTPELISEGRREHGWGQDAQAAPLTACIWMRTSSKSDWKCSQVSTRPLCRTTCDRSGS